MSDLSERFWAKVDRTPGFGPYGTCWRWLGAANRAGYGNVNVPITADGPRRKP